MKTCNDCKLEKTLEEFAKNPSKKDGRNYRCKECQKMYFKNWYANNTAYVLQHVKEWNARNKKTCEENIYKYLREHPCVDCGEDDILVLEFDHLSDKMAVVSTMLHAYSWKTVKKEIAKCEIRCGNCHKRKHALVNGNWKVKYLDLDK